jgi:branched-chain amino acid transport system permease protein
LNSPLPTLASPLRAALRSAFPALAILAAIGLPAVTHSYGLQIAYRVLLYAILAQAWNLIAGYCGLVSLGSAAFIGIGSYCFLEVTNYSSTPPMLALALSGLLASAFAMLISPAVFRLRGLYFSIGTLALAEALRLLMVNLPTFGGATGIFAKISLPSQVQLYYLTLAIAVVVTLLMFLLLRSRLSIAMRAIRDDEDVASEMGVLTFRIKLLAFVISAFVMGVAGALQVVKTGYSEPYGTFGLSWTIDVVMVTILGGVGTAAGPWLGALVVVLLGELLSTYPEIHTAINGAILILVIRFAPGGIWGAMSCYGRRAKRIAGSGGKPLAGDTV